MAVGLPPAPPLREPGTTCKTLGHFYERYYCADCGIQFCRAEHGGHSFECGSIGPPIGRDNYCYWCKRTIAVILVKDYKNGPMH
jgi:hypothetical protein